MNLLDVAARAEQLAEALDRAPVAVDPALCVRSRDKHAACTACLDSCPISAVSGETVVSIDTDACMVCGACLRACPTGAISGDDGVDQLMRFMDYVPGVETVELVCVHHPSASRGSPKVDAVIRTNRCLAALGPSAYLDLFRRGVRAVDLRLDLCHECALSSVRGRIEQTALESARFAERQGFRARIRPVDVPLDNAVPRQVSRASHPPMSRRGFFRAFARESDSDDPVAESIAAPSATTERRRLLRVLRAMSLPHPDEPCPPVFYGAQLALDGACSACGLCAGVCPTGALQLEKTDETFALSYSAAQCVDCGLCVPLCDTGALTRQRAATTAEFVAETPQMLAAGALTKCRKCGAPYIGNNQGGLCSLCDFRHKNPFTARMPPQLEARLAEIRASRSGG